MGGEELQGRTVIRHRAAHLPSAGLEYHALFERELEKGGPAAYKLYAAYIRRTFGVYMLSMMAA